MSRDVLHLLGTAQPRGTSVARIVAELAKGLAPTYRVQAWFLGGDGPMASELQAMGIPTQVVPWTGGSRDPAGALRFWRQARLERFDIVHQHWGGRSISWMARRVTGAKLVVHIHGSAAESDAPQPAARVVGRADALIAVSQATADWVVGQRPHVVYPGVRVPLDRVRTGDQGAACVLGAAGRLSPIKGLIYLVRAFASLRGTLADLRLEIAGTGPEQARLEGEVRSLGLTSHVAFLGWQSDLRPFFERWHIFVMPSLHEGFPLAALEAMAAGLPIVASAVGGLPEMVEHGRTGWLVPPAEPEPLAARLAELIRDPEQTIAMGAAGRIRVGNHFPVEQMVLRVSGIYDNLLGAP